MSAPTPAPRSNTPQVAAGPSEATSTVLTSSSQKATDGQATTTTTAINPTGVKLISGGIELDDGFFTAAVKAFTNLFSYHPIALICALIGTLYFLSHILEKHKTHSPFILMHATINNTHTKAVSNVGKSFSAVFLLLFTFFKKFEFFFASVAIFFFPYFCKSSKRNAIISMILVIYTMLSGISSISVLSLAYCYFLLAALRSPTHKTIIVLVAVVTVILGHEMVTELAK